jgi:hypothetical protein
MKRFEFIAPLIILMGCLTIVPESYSCTAICLKGAEGWVAGYNHDWIIKDALIMTNTGRPGSQREPMSSGNHRWAGTAEKHPA